MDTVAPLVGRLKVILTAWANISFDELRYIFTNAWAIANGLVVFVYHLKNRLAD